MNTRYTEILLFFSRLSRRNNKGFVIGMVLASGVVMTLIAAVMLVRSSSEKEKVTVQQHTAKGMAKADVGLIRIAQFLNQEQHQELIKKELGDWPSVATNIVTNYYNSNTTNTNNSANNPLEGVVACDNSQIPGTWGSTENRSGGENTNSSSSLTTQEFNEMIEDLRQERWIEIDDNDPSAGEFRLTSYNLLPEPEDRPPENPEPTMVQLEIEARGLDQDNSSSDLKLNNSIRKISVKLPILERSEDSSNATGTGNTALTPGLWVSDTNNGSGGNNDNSKQSSDSSKPNKPINAVTWIDCSQNSDWNTSESYVNSNKLDSTAIVIGETNINPTENGGVQQVRDNLPGIPSIPNSTDVRDMGSVNWSNCYVTLPLIDANKSTCSVPSGTDKAIGNAYYYKFTGGVSMNLSSVQIRINPPPNKKVIIFASGIIDITGTSEFNKYDEYYDKGDQQYKTFPNDYLDALQCRSGNSTEKVTAYIGDPTDPSKLEIYSSTSDEALKLQGQNIFSGFLHAPNTKWVQISQSQIRGGAWVKAMDASNSYGSGCDRSIKQMDVGQTLVMGGSGSQQGPPQNFTVLGQVSSYRSIEVEEEE